MNRNVNLVYTNLIFFIGPLYFKVRFNMEHVLTIIIFKTTQCAVSIVAPIN